MQSEKLQTRSHFMCAQELQTVAPGFLAGDSQQLATRLLRGESFCGFCEEQVHPTMLLMKEQEVLHFCINPHSAPEEFKKIYDAQKRFDCMGHLRVQRSDGKILSRWAEGDESICASMTLYDPSVVQRAKDILARFPKRDKVPAPFFVASCQLST